MKTFFAILISILSLGAAASPKFELRTFQNSQRQEEMANFICPYSFEKGVWRSWGSLFIVASNGLTSVAASLSDAAQGQSYSICMSQYSEQGILNDILMKAISVTDSDGQAYADPIGCKMDPKYSFHDIDSAVKSIQVGQAYEMNSPSMGSLATQMKVISYFIFPEENSHFFEEDYGQAWATQKCLDLVPGSIPTR